VRVGFRATTGRDVSPSPTVWARRAESAAPLLPAAALMRPVSESSRKSCRAGIDERVCSSRAPHRNVGRRYAVGWLPDGEASAFILSLARHWLSPRGVPCESTTGTAPSPFPPVAHEESALFLGAADHLRPDRRPVSSRGTHRLEGESRELSLHVRKSLHLYATWIKLQAVHPRAGRTSHR